MFKAEERDLKRRQRRCRLDIFRMSEDRHRAQVIRIALPHRSIVSHPQQITDRPYIEFHLKAQVDTSVDGFTTIVTASRTSKVCAMRDDSHSVESSAEVSR
ncbi:hypothetical protein GCM10022419_131030 [Nonomuraea rosea]|uniref:Uncharacterized protein n=1 Tax=Nonomuraea rosea TaxID=638574 RepID=A0ABP7A1N8_9ACTN